MPIELSPTSKGAQGSKIKAQQSEDIKLEDLDNTQQQDTKKSEQVDNQQEEAKSSSDTKVATGDEETTRDEGNKKSTTDTSRDESSTTGLPGKSKPAASASSGDEAIPGTSMSPSTTRSSKHTTITGPDAVKQSGSSGLVDVSVDPAVALPRTGVDEAVSKCQWSCDGDSSLQQETGRKKEIMDVEQLKLEVDQSKRDHQQRKTGQQFRLPPSGSQRAQASAVEPKPTLPSAAVPDVVPTSNVSLKTKAPSPSLSVKFEASYSSTTYPQTQPPSRFRKQDPRASNKVQFDGDDDQATDQGELQEQDGGAQENVEGQDMRDDQANEENQEGAEVQGDMEGAENRGGTNSSDEDGTQTSCVPNWCRRR